jgi:hypothetical protein
MEIVGNISLGFFMLSLDTLSLKAFLLEKWDHGAIK